MSALQNPLQTAKMHSAKVVLVAEPIFMPTFRSGLESGESRKPTEILPIVKSYKPIIIQLLIDEIKRSDNDQFAGDFRGRNGSAKYSWAARIPQRG